MMSTSATRESFAVIADVHGNSWALDSVLADIDARGIERIVALGDHVYGPLDPAAVADRLMSRGVLAVRGNEDRLVIDGLGPSHVGWLESLPLTLEPELGVLAFHGTPASDQIYFMWDVGDDSVRRMDDVEVARSVQAIAADRACCGSVAGLGLVLCGHDHVPRVIRCDESLVVNPGSVGLQAYSDAVPVPHVMEAGSPHARYAVVAKKSGRWVAEPVALEYDWDAAVRCAEAKGNPDWARWLATGRAG